MLVLQFNMKSIDTFALQLLHGSQSCLQGFLLLDMFGLWELFQLQEHLWGLILLVLFLLLFVCDAFECVTFVLCPQAVYVPVCSIEDFNSVTPKNKWGAVILLEHQAQCLHLLHLTDMNNGANMSPEICNNPRHLLGSSRCGLRLLLSPLSGQR